MKTFVTLVFVLVACFGNAQTENSLLWKIEGNGLNAPSYLYGTIHVMCPDDIVLTDKIKKALQQSEKLVLELDMDAPTFAQDMQKASLNENMQNRSAELLESQRKVIDTYFKEQYSADLSQLGILKPFALLSMMSMKGLDCPQPGSYEEALMQHAKNHDWEVLGVEKIEDQIAVFDQVAYAEQMGWLVSYIEDQDTFKKGFTKMVRAYQEENIQSLLHLMTDYPEYKEIEEALLYERNEKWIPALVQQMQEQATFIAVGAAHLASDRGVIALLQKAGYTVQPVLDENKVD